MEDEGAKECAPVELKGGGGIRRIIGRSLSWCVEGVICDNSGEDEALGASRTTDCWEPSWEGMDIGNDGYPTRRDVSDTVSEWAVLSGNDR